MKEQNIVNKILSDAELKAEQIVADAERKAEITVQSARDTAAKRREEQLALVSARNEETLRRREINARLECNKLMLAAKLKVLGGVFEGALKNLCALGEKEYLAFIESLLEKYAEEGETVILSERCPCKEGVYSLAVIRERSLSVSKDRGKFAGGLMLIGGGCDKNLTFEALVSAAREEKQAEVAAKLFD